VNEIEPDLIASRGPPLTRSHQIACLTPFSQPIEADMPAKSKKQQMAAGAALAAKRGEKPKASLKGASKQMAESMSETELKKMASVKRKKLPKRAATK
jgi:hypothetical protein